MNRSLLPLIAVALLSACNPAQKKADIPPPAPFDPQASAHFCGMAVGEHPGPKGQVWVDGQPGPMWFASVHDTIAFTLLPEEPKDIRAIYVNDMGKAASWQAASEGGWVEARNAVYVIDSSAAGGMGNSEEVPFSDRSAAEAFTGRYGGRIVSFADIPRDHILGTPVSGQAASGR